MSFSFAAALFALPLAAAPVLLHLLFRQKSPVVMFSTLRFVKLSVQQTAARKKVQKWLLLAIRSLLIALLIWAIAQPVRLQASAWLGGGRSVAAAVVIDTSYSMLLQDEQTPLLSKVDATVQELLRKHLNGAKVAVFTSQSTGPETLRESSAVLADWSPLAPQPAVKPLADRVTAAAALLGRQPADQKWLVVVSDFQSHEFSHPVPAVKGGRTVLFDLHPGQPHSSGVTKITVTPDVPIPGIPAEAVVEVTGHAGDARTVTVAVTKADGTPVSQSSAEKATLDTGGRGVARFQVKLPAERWVNVTASLTASDDMPWDDTRTQLVEVPPKQKVALLEPSAETRVERFVRLALDPTEGQNKDWPVAVIAGRAIPAGSDAAVAVWRTWPDARTVTAVHSFVADGHSLTLFLTPGMERDWTKLPAQQQVELADLLPSVPGGRVSTVTTHAAVVDPNDSLLSGLTDPKFELTSWNQRGVVPMTAQGSAVTVLNAVPAEATADAKSLGLVYRKPFGRGAVVVVATTPDPEWGNLITRPTFLPLVVKSVLPPPGRSGGRNVDLGSTLVLDGSLFPGVETLQIDTPKGEPYRVPVDSHGQFVFDRATLPGAYVWHKVDDAKPAAITNVQLPAAESDLSYRDATTLTADGDTIVAHSLADLDAKVAAMTTPQPQWSLPLAVVMLLLCAEAMMGSLARRKPSPADHRLTPVAA